MYHAVMISAETQHNQVLSSNCGIWRHLFKYNKEYIFRRSPEVCRLSTSDELMNTVHNSFVIEKMFITLPSIGYHF